MTKRGAVCLTCQTQSVKRQRESAVLTPKCWWCEEEQQDSKRNLWSNTSIGCTDSSGRFHARSMESLPDFPSKAHFTLGQSAAGCRRICFYCKWTCRFGEKNEYICEVVDIPHLDTFAWSTLDLPIGFPWHEIICKSAGIVLSKFCSVSRQYHERDRHCVTDVRFKV